MRWNLCRHIYTLDGDQTVLLMKRCLASSLVPVNLDMMTWLYVLFSTSLMTHRFNADVACCRRSRNLPAFPFLRDIPRRTAIEAESMTKRSGTWKETANAFAADPERVLSLDERTVDWFLCFIGLQWCHWHSMMRSRTSFRLRKDNSEGRAKDFSIRSSTFFCLLS